MIIITAKKDGFRRCGVAHGAMPTTYQPDAFTPAQLAELQADPMLVVEITAPEGESKDPNGGTKKDGKKAGKE